MANFIIGRPSGPKTRCSGAWTEAKFNSFIKNQLRGASRKWAPIGQCYKAANVRRGVYLCNGCKEEVPASIPDEKVPRKRHKNAVVDHINPIIDPDVGFTTWDECIDRMFCELDNLQVLCKACHDTKSKEENERAKIRRAREREAG